MFIPNARPIFHSLFDNLLGFAGLLKLRLRGLLEVTNNASGFTNLLKLILIRFLAFEIYGPF